MIPTEHEGTVAVDAAARRMYDATAAQVTPPPPPFDALDPLVRNQYRDAVLPFVWAALEALPDRAAGKPDVLPFVAVETVGDYADDERDEYGNVIGHTADPAKFPTDEYAAVLDKVMDDVDGATCAMPDCDQPIGWVLHETDDGIGSGLSWRWTTLVAAADGTVIAVCEDDDPGNLYDNAADILRRMSAARRDLL